MIASNFYTHSSASSRSARSPLLVPQLHDRLQFLHSHSSASSRSAGSLLAISCRITPLRLCSSPLNRSPFVFITLCSKCDLTFEWAAWCVGGMYVKCGALDDALKVFYEIPVNAIILGCIQNEYFNETAKMCWEMSCEEP